MKKCFKCNQEKLISEFYKHPKTADGYLNKCKECNKKDTRNYYKKNSKNELWLEKERKRCVIKNRRLGYNKKYPLDCLFKISEYKNLRKKLGVLKPYEIHHWNYNEGFVDNVIILHIKEHKKAHEHLFRKKGEYVFKNDKGCILDTKENHIKYLKEIGVKIFREF